MSNVHTKRSTENPLMLAAELRNRSLKVRLKGLPEAADCMNAAATTLEILDSACDVAKLQRDKALEAHRSDETNTERTTP